MNNNEFNIAEAKKHFSEIITVLLMEKKKIVIKKRGKPLATLVPPQIESGSDHPSNIKGGLDNDDLTHGQHLRHGTKVWGNQARI